MAERRLGVAEVLIFLGGGIMDAQPVGRIDGRSQRIFESGDMMGVDTLPAQPGEAEMRATMGGIARQDRFILRLGLDGPVEEAIGAGEVEAIIDIVGCRSHRTLEQRQRGGVIAKPRIDAADRVDRHRIGAFRLCRSTIGRHPRIGFAAGEAEQATMLGKIFGIARRNRDGALDRLQRYRDPTTLAHGNAEQEMRFRIVTVRRQSLCSDRRTAFAITPGQRRTGRIHATKLMTRSTVQKAPMMPTP
jgi:hypothetical protein